MPTMMSASAPRSSVQSLALGQASPFTLLWGVALLCCALLFALPATAQDIPASGAVDGRAGQQLINDFGEKLTVLDVRSPAEFAQGHIPTAMLIPLQELDARINEVPADKPLLIVCRTGRRAQIAYEHLQQARPEQTMWFLAGTPKYNSDNTYSLQ
jgi:rhodanese-related sulfurtransferase